MIKETQAQSEFLLDESMLELLRQHFWCDFSDVISFLAWDETARKN